MARLQQRYRQGEGVQAGFVHRQGDEQGLLVTLRGELRRAAQQADGYRDVFFFSRQFKLVTGC
jgi:hypothetical protein